MGMAMPKGIIMNDKIKPWEHFDVRSSEWSKLYQRAVFKDRLSLFLKAVENTGLESVSVLDYGCGTGIISAAIADRGHVVKGVDASIGMIENARTLSEGVLPEKLSFSVINPDDLQLGVALYDVIVCSSVLEYVDDDVALLDKFATALKPGGRLVFTVPHDRSVLASIEDFIKNVSKRGQQRDVAHCRRRYNKVETKGVLENIGLVDMSTEYFEVPKLGRLGVLLSRLPIFGLMMMVKVTKRA